MFTEGAESLAGYELPEGFGLPGGSAVTAGPEVSVSPGDHPGDADALADGHDCLLAAACAGFWEALAAVGEGDLARAYAALLEPVVEDLPAFAERLLARGGRAASVVLTAG